MSVINELSKPNEWEAIPLGRLTVRTQIRDRPDLDPLSVFLDEGVVPRFSRDDNRNRLSDDLSKYLVVRPGDIVFNKLRTWQGGFGVSSYTGIVSPAYFVCRPLDGFNPRFLHYLLRSSPYLQELTRLSKWMPPSQFDISWDQLRKLPILLPPISQQHDITKCLDTETVRIDQVISKKQRMIALIDERWNAWVRDELSLLKSPLLPLKRGWQVLDCKHRTPSYVDDGYAVVSPGDIGPGRLDISRAHRFVDELDYCDLTEGDRRPKKGDVVYSRNASIGIASYIDTDEPFCMGQDVCLITSDAMDQLFLMYVLNSIGLDQLGAQKIGSTFSRVNIAQILELKVPVPSRSDQDALARKFDQAGSQRSYVLRVLQQQIDLLRERRQALITGAVTGELDIPGAAA